MAFNISNFSSKVNSYGGLAKDNLTVVSISPPSVLQSGMPAEDLSFFCRAVSIPSLNISTADIQTRGFGLKEKRPVDMPYDTLNTVFMVDSKFEVKKFFHAWMQSITNYDNSKGHDYVYNGMYPFQFEYKNGYVGDLDVIVYSVGKAEMKYNYKFGNAFPINIGEISTSWENNNSIMLLPVQFAFDIYKVDAFGESSKGIDASATLESIPNIGQALDAIGAQQPIQDIVNKYTSISDQIKSTYDKVTSPFQDFF